MKSFTVPTREIVSSNNQVIFDRFIKQIGFMPNLIAMLAHSETALADGKNDVLRPIAAGIAKMETFQIFNRWGQRVFSTTTSELGWDGTIAGKPQPSGTYVWLVKAVDHTGAPYMQRGTLVLIR